MEYPTEVTIERQNFLDRKSTRLNSSHDQISYAVFCLKKKKKTEHFRKDKKNKTRKYSSEQRYCVVDSMKEKRNNKHRCAMRAYTRHASIVDNEKDTVS